jgi:hypothetical protein
VSCPFSPFQRILRFKRHTALAFLCFYQKGDTKFTKKKLTRKLVTRFLLAIPANLTDDLIALETGKAGIEIVGILRNPPDSSHVIQGIQDFQWYQTASTEIFWIAQATLTPPPHQSGDNYGDVKVYRGVDCGEELSVAIFAEGVNGRLPDGFRYVDAEKLQICKYG